MEYKISVSGLYNMDNTIFDLFAFPVTKTARELGLPDEAYIPDNLVAAITFDGEAGKENRETFINRVLLDSLPFSVIYANPETLKYAIKYWSRSRLPTWQALFDTLFFRYNPLWNKDATHTENTETVTDTQKNQAANTLTRTTYSGGTKDRDTRFVNSYEEGDTSMNFDTNIDSNHDITYMTKKNLESNSSGNHEHMSEGTVNNLSNDNQGAYIKNTAPAPEETESLKWTHSNMDDSYHNMESTTNFDQGFTEVHKNNENASQEMSWREYGNIGVMSTQELIEKSRNIALFNIYDIMVSDFIKQFCVMVY